jgi:hypothetical protein
MQQAIARIALWRDHAEMTAREVAFEGQRR